MADEQDHAGGKIESFADVAERHVASGKDGMPSGSKLSVSISGDATPSIKGETDQESIARKGYDRVSSQLDDRGHHAPNSYTGIRPDNGSMIYYMPGYNQFAADGTLGVDGQRPQPYLTSPGYLQPSISYGSDAFPCYSWDSTFVGDACSGVMAKSGSLPISSLRSNNWNSINYNGAIGKSSALPLPSKSHQYMASSNFSKSNFQNQSVKPLNKVPYLGPDFQPVGLIKGLQPGGKISSFANQRQGVFRQIGPTSYRSDSRMWFGSDRYKSRDSCDGGDSFDALAELTRGPRGQKSSAVNSSVEKEGLGLTVRKDQYNRQDFQIQYDAAKFYVIKSYTEDNIHKSIKYDVWASTPNGNKKLDAAFHEMEAKSTEKSCRCPIFLFFSVNGSGQFVGLAEMIGQVDFNKDMNFWQMDKWNGFFPVKWHIIKDVPNTQLKHIILENNDNKPVTYSRDTQEIGLKQGLEMLEIFKSYVAKTSILDDFEFYEDREKLLHNKKGNKPASTQAEVCSYTDSLMHPKGDMKAGEESVRAERVTDPAAASLVNLTKNLSLDDDCPPKNQATPESVDG